MASDSKRESKRISIVPIRKIPKDDNIFEEKELNPKYIKVKKVRNIDVIFWTCYETIIKLIFIFLQGFSFFSLIILYAALFELDGKDFLINNTIVGYDNCSSIYVNTFINFGMIILLLHKCDTFLRTDYSFYCTRRNIIKYFNGFYSPSGIFFGIQSLYFLYITNLSCSIYYSGKVYLLIVVYNITIIINSVSFICYFILKIIPTC